MLNLLLAGASAVFALVYLALTFPRVSSPPKTGPNCDQIIQDIELTRELVAAARMEAIRPPLSTTAWPQSHQDRYQEAVAVVPATLRGAW